jgi:hypothetical protein
MIAITIQSALPGFMVRDKLRDLGLAEGYGAMDDGIVRLPAGVWEIFDHGRGRVTIRVQDDELEAARKVIHNVFPNAIEEEGP